MSEGLHYFNTDETRLKLKEGDFVEYYDRYEKRLIIVKILGNGFSVRMYKGLILSSPSLVPFDKRNPFIDFRGLACNTRLLDKKMATLLYD